MKKITLKGFERPEVGKKVAKKLRADEQVPCVVYGGEKNLHLHVTEKELKKIIETPNVYLINIEFEGKSVDCVLQDIQYHPVSDRPIHVDFLEINDQKPVKIQVPVKLTGFAEGVKQGGKLSLNMRRLKVKAIAANLPDFVEIDITNLKLGKTIKVGELSFDNIELLDAKNAVVVAVRLTRAARGNLQAAKE